MENENEPRLFQILGGRKMTLAWVAILLGTAIEIATERGITVNFASFLTAIVTGFGVANVVATVKTASGGATNELANIVPATENVLQQFKAELDASKAETKRDIEAGANAVQGLANTIENMKKVITALATGKKVS